MPRILPSLALDGGLKQARVLVAAAALVCASFAPSAPARAAENYDVHVVLPLTGGASFVGEGQRAVLQALADSVNKSGGVQSRDLRFVFHDDQTSAQVAVQQTTSVLSSKPAVVMGSALVGQCLAMAPLMKNGPVHYCLSPAIHPQPGSFVFSSSTSSLDQIAAIVRYYRLKGWTKLAVLNTIDASGQDGDKAVDTVLAMPENQGKMQKVAAEHFNVTDLSVTAQLERVRASGAQAIIAWTTGAPAATVLKGMAQAGLDLPVAPTSGNQNFEAMKQWSSFLPKQLILASALYPPHDGLLQLDPRMETAQHDMYKVLEDHHLRADNQIATAWDAGQIVVSALRKLGPSMTAAQLKDYIANLTDYVGVDGIYDFKKYPERGLGPEASTITTYDPKTDSWVWLSKPGGEPLH